MKKRISWIVIALGVFTSVTPGLAQEQDGCFLRDNKGKLIDLGGLCGNKKDSPPQNSSNTSGNFRIPIKRRTGGVPVIEVTFNGKQRYEMAFDTGASTITITPKMAQELNVKLETKAVISTANGEVVADVGRVSSAAVGGVMQKDLTVIIAPGVPMGLLGQNFFGEHDVTIKANEILINSRSK